MAEHSQNDRRAARSVRGRGLGSKIKAGLASLKDFDANDQLAPVSVTARDRGGGKARIDMRDGTRSGSPAMGPRPAASWLALGSWAHRVEPAPPTLAAQRRRGRFTAVRRGPERADSARK